MMLLVPPNRTQPMPMRALMAVPPALFWPVQALAVPMPRLQELRLGQGRVCARYDLRGPEERGWTVLGEQRIDGVPLWTVLRRPG